MRTLVFAALLPVFQPMTSCGNSTPTTPTTPAAPTYNCDHAFDDGCRYSAEVEWQSATLSEASISWLLTSDTDHSAQIDNAVIEATIMDLDGVHPTVTCTVNADLVLVGVEDADGGMDALWEVNWTLDSACPLTCPWFLPTSGQFSDDAGRFGLGYFEGQFDVNWGPVDPADPSYTEWNVPFQLGSTDFDPSSGWIGLNAPTELYPSSYEVPVALPGTFNVDTCQ
jgi:hypothetical protein